MKKIFVLLVTILALVVPARAEIMAMQPNVKLGIGERPAVMFVKLHNKGAATRLKMHNAQRPRNHKRGKLQFSTFHTVAYSPSKSI